MCDTGTSDAFTTMPITIRSNLKTPESEIEQKTKNVIKPDMVTFDTIPEESNTQNHHCQRKTKKNRHNKNEF